MSIPFPPSSVYLRPFRTQTTPSVHPTQSVKPYGGGSVVVVVALIIFYSSPTSRCLRSFPRFARTIIVFMYNVNIILNIPPSLLQNNAQRLFVIVQYRNNDPPAALSHVRLWPVG